MRKEFDIHEFIQLLYTHEEFNIHEFIQFLYTHEEFDIHDFIWLLHTCVGGAMDFGTACREYRVRDRALQTLSFIVGGPSQLPENRAGYRNQERSEYNQWNYSIRQQR